MKSAPLTVCVASVDNIEDIVVPLNEIASGHLLGPKQNLKLVLHGQDRESLDELALTVQESCYPLVDEVCVSSTAVGHYDVTVILLSQTNPPLNMPSPSYDRSSSISSETEIDISLLSSVSRLSHFLNDKISDTSKILVMGPSANTAATLLSRRLRGMGGNQLLAFQTEQNARAPRGGQYKTAFTMSNTISKWWTGAKDPSTKIEVGIKFSGGNKSMPIRDTNIFFSVPVDIVREKTFRVDPVCQIDTEKLNRVVYKTESALQEMQNEVNKEDKNENKNVRFHYSHL